MDLIVDGIRRDSAVTSGPGKSINHIFKRSCHQEKHKTGKKGELKSCAMEVQCRNAEKGEIRSTHVRYELTGSDIAWNNGSTSPSAVGTLQIQLFRMLDVASQTQGANSCFSSVIRAPTFIKYATWHDLNPYIDLSTTLSFEIRCGPVFSILLVL